MTSIFYVVDHGKHPVLAGISFLQRIVGAARAPVAGGMTARKTGMPFACRF
jgi:hypothetical protein